MHKLAELCVKRPVFATMLIVALMVVGIFSFFTLGVDLFPKIDLPTVSVSVSNPGASAEEDGNRHHQAHRRCGQHHQRHRRDQLHLGGRRIHGGHPFSLDKNGDVAAQEIRDKVNLIVNDLPETAKAPVVQKFDPDATPIMEIVLSSPRPLREVTEIADKQIKPQLENINGIGQIQLVGGLKREIRVWVDPDKMRAYNLAISDVANALRQQNMEMPAGNVNAGARELAVRTLGRLVDPAQFDEIAIATRGSYVVKLRDIGHAEDSQEEPTTAARLNGEPAVTMVVSKQSGQNTVAAADALKERIKQVQAAAAERHSHSDHQRSVDLHQGAVHSLEAAPGRRQHPGRGHRLRISRQHPHHVDLGGRHSDVHHFHLRADGRDGVRPESDHHAGADADGGHRDRRRHYCPRKYLPLHGREGHVAVSGGDRRHEGNRPGRDGHHVVAAGRVSAHRLHGRHRRPLHVVVRIHGVFRDRGFVAGVLHADADAQLAVRQSASQARGREDSQSSKDSRFFHFLDRITRSMLEWSMAHRKSMVALSVAVVLSTIPLFMLVGKNFMPADDRSEFQASIRAPEGTSLAATVTIAERIARDFRALPGVSATSDVGRHWIGFLHRIERGRSQQRIHLREAGPARRSQGYAGSKLIAKAREILTHYPEGSAHQRGPGSRWRRAAGRPMCSSRSPGRISTSSTPIRKRCSPS